jgi:hypothetical protein
MFLLRHGRCACLHIILHLDQISVCCVRECRMAGDSVTRDMRIKHSISIEVIGVRRFHTNSFLDWTIKGNRVCLSDCSRETGSGERNCIPLMFYRFFSLQQITSNAEFGGFFVPCFCECYISRTTTISRIAGEFGSEVPHSNKRTNCTCCLLALSYYLLIYSMEQSPSWEANSKLCS